MSYPTSNKLLTAPRRVSITLIVVVISLASCGKIEKPAAEKAPQQTFASPEDAGATLLAAARSGDRSALLAIFGPDGKDVLFMGDPVKEQNNLNDFVASYNQMHRWGSIKAGGKILYVGADNNPFPIPLDENSSGQWSFDTPAGKDEILARRIGRGELTAIASCDAIAAAEEQYFRQTHDGSSVKQYAQKFVSDEGKQNGLYWPAPQGQAPSPLGPLADLAKALGYTNASDKPQPFNGYYFRILTKQANAETGGAQDYIVDGKMTRGFAVLAYPAHYRNTGIMTFIVGKDGVVFQKDLGEGTTETGVAMTEYDPSEGWTPAT